jgi:tape measure domain-containing protein
MAVKIGNLYFQVSANTSSAQSSILGLGDVASTAAGLVSGALSTAFDAAAFAAKTATALIVKEVIGMGAAFNIAGQQATALFTALTGSAEEARTLLAEFSQLSLDTPVFDAAGLQRTTSLLLTFRVAKDEAFELAKNIELAAIALGRGQMGATQLARAIGQIQGRGWLEGDEARQLSEVGVNAYAVIADALGKTTAEVIEMGRQSQLLAEDVLPILNNYLEETFGPVAQNMLDTFSVQVQGIKNVFQGIGSALVEPFIGRTGGGAIPGVLGQIREELASMVSVGEDGSFALTGALAPLMMISEALAEAFGEAGNALIGWLDDAAASGGLESFASGVAAAIPMLMDGLQMLGSAGVDLITGVWDALQPLLPGIQELAGIIYDFAVDALPELVRGITAVMDATGPLAASMLEISTAVLSVLGPIIGDLITALADTLEILAELAPYIETAIALWIAWKGAILIAEIATASFTTVTLSALSVQLIAVAGYAAAALAILGSIKAIGAGLSGDLNWLNEDVPFYEKPFQIAGRAGFALTGGDRGAVEEIAQFEAGRQAAEDFNLSLLDNAEDFGQARQQALQYAAGLNLTADAAADFANLVALAWKDYKLAQDQALGAEAYKDGPIFGDQEPLMDFKDILGGITEDLAALGKMRVLINGGDGFVDVPLIEESTDFIKLLEGAAKSAEDALKSLFRADAGATVDDFLLSLPDLATAVGEALAGPDGAFKDVEVRSSLDAVSGAVRKAVQTLALDYGMSMEEIIALFDERGLAGVLSELGIVTMKAAEEVDPLIAKYGDFGVSVDIVSQAVDNLNEERDSRLEAQIDAVTTALDAAKQAAEEAQQALEDYFTGGTGGIQNEIDKLVTDIPKIGDSIEEGLLKGGPQGEAMIRMALNDAGGQLGAIFQAGMDQGLNVDQIMAMLAPVYGSITQEVNGALNRISSLDWTEGFTPGAASEIQSWLDGILDPSKITGLFNNAANAEGMVTGLEAELEALNLEKSVDATFSREQVQAAIDEIVAPTVPLDIVVTPEVEALIREEIQGVFTDEDMKIAIDNAKLTNDILDAAKAAEDNINLEFQSSLVFNRETLTAMADVVGGNFAAFFGQRLRDIFSGREGEGFASLMIPTSFPDSGTSSGGGTAVVVNNDIKIDGAQTPIATATEVVRASSSSAGSGGRLYDTYGRIGQNTPR